MDKLELRGLENVYVKMNEGEKEVYYDSKKNNIILINPLDNDCNVDTICNGISDDAYNELIEILNDGYNIVVHWSQVSGTTSDYTIFFHIIHHEELHKRSFNEILEELKDYVFEDERIPGYKYTYVVDMHEYKIELNRSNDKNGLH